MPQYVANGFAINDGSATPASVTYAPAKLSSEETIFEDRRLPTRAFWPAVKYYFSRTSAQRKTDRVSREYSYPIVRTTPGGDTVVGIARVDVKYTFPEDCTEQERKHVQAFVVNGENHAYFKDGAIKLDPMF